MLDKVGNALTAKTARATIQLGCATENSTLSFTAFPAARRSSHTFISLAAHLTTLTDQLSYHLKTASFFWNVPFAKRTYSTAWEGATICIVACQSYPKIAPAKHCISHIYSCKHGRHHCFRKLHRLRNLEESAEKIGRGMTQYHAYRACTFLAGRAW